MTVLTVARATSIAPPSAFFARWADMDTWPEWDEAILWIRRNGPFAEGTTGTLRPRGGPKMAFVIRALEDGREFTDCSTMVGATLTIRHLVAVEDDGRTLVEIEVSIDGLLARLWKPVLGRGIARSTLAGLHRLVELAEADTAQTADSPHPGPGPER